MHKRESWHNGKQMNGALETKGWAKGGGKLHDSE